MISPLATQTNKNVPAYLSTHAFFQPNVQQLTFGTRKDETPRHCANQKDAEEEVIHEPETCKDFLKLARLIAKEKTPINAIEALYELMQKAISKKETLSLPKRSNLFQDRVNDYSNVIGVIKILENSIRRNLPETVSMDLIEKIRTIMQISA